MLAGLERWIARCTGSRLVENSAAVAIFKVAFTLTPCEMSAAKHS